KQRCILKSGFPSCDLENDAGGNAEFLSGCSMIFRSSDLSELNWPLALGKFGGYCLGEDVYISHSVRKKGKLVVIDNAWVVHHYTPGKRWDNKNFASAEVWNNYIFVRDLRLGNSRLAFGWALLGLLLIDIAKTLRFKSISYFLGWFAGVKAMILSNKQPVNHVLGSKGIGEM
ncbi:MAG TPA: hypothetical protein VF941_24040, partial [Clostridia bacterium]